MYLEQFLQRWLSAPPYLERNGTFGDLIWASQYKQRYGQLFYTANVCTGNQWTPACSTAQITTSQPRNLHIITILNKNMAINNSNMIYRTPIIPPGCQTTLFSSFTDTKARLRYSLSAACHKYSMGYLSAWNCRASKNRCITCCTRTRK